jgi:hypothetical protein
LSPIRIDSLTLRERTSMAESDQPAVTKG